MKKFLLIIMFLLVGTLSFSQDKVKFTGFDGYAFGLLDTTISGKLNLDDYDVSYNDKESIFASNKALITVYEMNFQKYYHFTNHKFDFGAYFYITEKDYSKNAAIVFLVLWRNLEKEAGKDYDKIFGYINQNKYDFGDPYSWPKAILEDENHATNIKFVWYNVNNQTLSIEIKYYSKDQVVVMYRVEQ